jgi:short-subunit dehydrogenase
MTHSVITGAADGIGRAVALECARRGVAVTCVDRDVTRLAALEAELTALGAAAGVVPADLATPEEVARVAATLADGPPIDLLVHSAGISAVGRFLAVDPVQQRAVLAVNLTAPILLSEALLGRGRIARGGTLVFLASLSVFTGYPGALGYAASKAGLAAYARSLGAAVRRRGINVLTVFPGPTRTAHARRYAPDNANEDRRMAPERLAELIAAAVAARRRRLVPGAANRLFAGVGRIAPALTEYAMRKTILDRLPAVRQV